MKKSTVFTRFLLITTILALLPSLLHADLMDNLILKKTRIGLSAVSALAIPVTNGMLDRSGINIPKMLMDGLKFEEEIYNVTRPITSIHMKHGGILLVTPGKAFTLSRISLPANKSKTVCNYEKDRMVLNLGVASQRRDESAEDFNHRSSTTIFRLTYVDALPHIEVGGRAFVHVSRGFSQEKNVIKLTGSAMYVCSSLDAPAVHIAQGKATKLKIDRLNAPILDGIIQVGASTVINGLTVANAKVLCVGGASGTSASTTLSGNVETMSLELGNYSKFDGSGCCVKDMDLHAKRNFSSAIVNVSNILTIKGTKGSAFIEYSGNPTQIKNEPGIDLKRASFLGGAINKIVDTFADTFARRPEKATVKQSKNGHDREDEEHKQVVDVNSELAPQVQ